ncbi:MAG: DNA-protecting protein DprA [Firmicutes bacterium]|nr:DNA-protecting protein DprA [Bacillota bacterium]
MEERAFWLALIKVPGLGTAKIHALVNHFGRAETAWRAAPAEVAKVKGIGPHYTELFVSGRAGIVPERELETVLRRGMRVLIFTDPEYPQLLKQIHDPPPVLFVKGSLRPEDSRAIAVVGSRNATPFGRSAAGELAAGLALAGVCVVSGLARGIDTAAHQGALKAGGRTIAVLGNGLDTVYPPENRTLFRKIEEAGAVISEYPPGSRPDPRHFPARNRIISGLSRGVVVVESAEGGGALITADFALEQGRDVFAVPGPASSQYSVGTNRLIEEGARPVRDVQGILDEYGWPPGDAGPAGKKGRSKQSGPGLNELQKRIVKTLSLEPRNIESVKELTGIGPAQLAAQLMLLEINGVVIKLPGGQYILKRGSV